MNIIIEVVTPGNGRSYDIMLDDKLTVGAAKEKIMEQIIAFENGCIDFDTSVAMFSPLTRSKLPDNRNVRKAGMKGGQTIYLL